MDGMYLLFLIPFVMFLNFSSQADSLGNSDKRAIELYNQGTLSNDLVEKERCFRAAIAIGDNPEVLAKAYNNLADVYERRKEYAKALTYYRKAIELKNNLVTPYVSVGNIFSTLGDFYSAFIMYGKGLKYNPTDEDAQKGIKEMADSFKNKMVIYFDFDSFKIPEEYQYRLQLIGELLDTLAKQRVEVIGYTCSIGPKAYNQILAERRAEVVAQYLREHCSIAGDIITTISRGEENPMLPNKDKAARILNRRVEVIIKSETF